jgi:hypothetical protein
MPGKRSATASASASIKRLSDFILIEDKGLCDAVEHVKLVICETVSSTTGETLTKDELEAEVFFDASPLRLTLTPRASALGIGICPRSVRLMQDALTIRAKATGTPASEKVASLHQIWTEQTRPNLKGTAADSEHGRKVAKVYQKEYRTSNEKEDQHVIAIQWYTLAHEFLRTFGIFKTGSKGQLPVGPPTNLSLFVTDTILWVWHCQLRQDVHVDILSIADLIVAYNNASKAKDMVKCDARALAVELVSAFDEQVADAEVADAVAMLRPFVEHAAQALLLGDMSKQSGGKYGYEYKDALMQFAHGAGGTTMGSLDAIKVRYLKTLLSGVALVDHALVAKGCRGGLEQMLRDDFNGGDQTVENGEEEEGANQKEQAESSSAPKKKPSKKKSTQPPPTTSLFMRSGCVAFMRNRFFLYFAQTSLQTDFLLGAPVTCGNALLASLLTTCARPIAWRYWTIVLSILSDARAKDTVCSLQRQGVNDSW